MRETWRIVLRRREGIIAREWKMRAPYGLQIVESCVTCPFREERLFCDLSPDAVKTLASITSSATYPKGAMLFLEGQPPRGVFIVCNGRVKLSTSSADGKTLILKLAEPGEVLGLAANISGQPYELTAETLAPSQANFIQRQDFLSFLRQHGDAALHVAEQLSITYHAAFSEMRSLGLSHSAAEKFARFLLDWPAQDAKSHGEIHLKLTLTHEEIAQMIGASRETVTRLFAEFKKKQLVQLKGSTLVIRNRAALEGIVNP